MSLGTLSPAGELEPELGREPGSEAVADLGDEEMEEDCRACTSAMASRMSRMERTTFSWMTARQDARSAANA